MAEAGPTEQHGEDHATHHPRRRRRRRGPAARRLRARRHHSGTGEDRPVTPTPSKTVTKTAEAAASPTKTRTAKPTRIRVPNVVGHNHQEAQNEMQAHGLFFLAEEDATGQNRLLLWDRNWVVVRQTPSAGTAVKSDTTITLYSKKIGE